MHDNTYRIRAAKPDEQHQTNPIPSSSLEKPQWQEKHNKDSDRMTQRKYGQLKGNAYTKAVKFVEKHGALNWIGEYGSIQIDPKDFDPIEDL
jgi:hypothetical protein